MGTDFIILEKIKTVGGLVLEAIFSEFKNPEVDGYRIWFSSILLGHIIQSNKQCKQFGINFKVIAFQGY